MDFSIIVLYKSLGAHFRLPGAEMHVDFSTRPDRDPTEYQSNYSYLHVISK